MGKLKKWFGIRNYQPTTGALRKGQIAKTGKIKLDPGAEFKVATAEVNLDPSLKTSLQNAGVRFNSANQPYLNMGPRYQVPGKIVKINEGYAIKGPEGWRTRWRKGENLGDIKIIKNADTGQYFAQTGIGEVIGLSDNALANALNTSKRLRWGKIATTTAGAGAVGAVGYNIIGNVINGPNIQGTQEEEKNLLDPNLINGAQNGNIIFDEYGNPYQVEEQQIVDEQPQQVMIIPLEQFVDNMSILLKTY